MSLRRADVCIRCGVPIDAGSRAEWDPQARVVTCMACVESREVADLPQPDVRPERGSPGASAQRRYDKLHAKRQVEVKQRFGRRLGGVYLALSDEPQSTQAWRVGSKGERALGQYLESLHDDSRVIVLHDRRIPGSRANIDHIAICRSGIYAIDAKNYTGKVQRIDRGGWFSTDLRLYVGRRDCTKFVSGMEKQVAAIKSALGDALIEELSIDVKAALCFVDAEWSLFAKPFVLTDVWIGWAKALGELLLEDGPIAPEYLVLVADRVAARLPVA
jgi:Nuclease-related domain